MGGGVRAVWVVVRMMLTSAGRPVPALTSGSCVMVPSLSAFSHPFFSLALQFGLGAVEACLWWGVVDSAVWGSVVDRHPSADPGVSFAQRGKGFWIVSPGFQGLEHRLGVRVVLAGVQPVQRTGHTVRGEEFAESFAGHRSSVVGVHGVHFRRVSDSLCAGVGLQVVRESVGVSHG